MAERPKFRRRKGRAAEAPPEDDMRPVPPLDDVLGGAARMAEVDEERAHEIDEERAPEDAEGLAEADRLREEEAENAARTERLRREQAERDAEAERLRREDAEKAAETERLRREQAERDAEAERLRLEEAENAAETERLSREQAERDAEAERLRREEAERDAETERMRQEEAARAAESERLSREQRDRDAEAERIRLEDAERAAREDRLRQQEAERHRQEQAARDAEEDAGRKDQDEVHRDAGTDHIAEAERSPRQDSGSATAAASLTAGPGGSEPETNGAVTDGAETDDAEQDDEQDGAEDAPVTTRWDSAVGPERVWDRMRSFPLDGRRLDRQRIVTAARQDPAHVTFDVLRTRLLQALAERGWSRVAVTSPTKGCGKTFATANLGISLSRQENLRTVILDLDLRRPTLHSVFGIERPGNIAPVLTGEARPESHLCRFGPNAFHAGRMTAFGFNDTPEPYAAELLQAPRTRAALDDLEARLEPDVMLFDLPPALVSDDVLALRPAFDAVLLVVGGGLTTEAEIRAVEHRLGEDTPLLGIVLNKAEGTQIRKYAY